MQLQCGHLESGVPGSGVQTVPPEPSLHPSAQISSVRPLLRQARSQQPLRQTGKRQDFISSQSLIPEKRGRLLPSHPGNSPGESIDWPGPDHVPILDPITEPGGKESGDRPKLGPLGTLEKSNGSCWSGLRMGLTLESCSVARKMGAGKVCLAL